MNRISTRYTITEIEAIIERGLPHAHELHRWRASGVDCARTRHRYSGPHYDFTIEVIELQYRRGDRLQWHAILVTDWWRATGDAQTELRATKWLKLISGRSNDVSSWLRAARAREEFDEDSRR